MRPVLISSFDESYLKDCLKQRKFAFGIAIGQHVDTDKDVVIHLAKNNEEQSATMAGSNQRRPENILDINKQALTNQWIRARRMLAGSFDILGMFVSCVKLEMDLTFANAKKLLDNMYNVSRSSSLAVRTFTGNENIFGDLVDGSSSVEILVLAHCATSGQIVAKSYVPRYKGGIWKDLQVCSMDQPFVWYSFECTYEFDNIFSVGDTVQLVNDENQFRTSIEAIKRTLKSSEIFIRNEHIDDTLPLQEYIAQKYGRSSSPDCVIQASICLPLSSQMIAGHPVRVEECNVTMRFPGSFSARVWCYPDNTMGAVKHFLRKDILRSMISRMQAYSDGLPDLNMNSDAIFISDPPRRVFFSLESLSHVRVDGLPPIQFSDYIFDDDAVVVAVENATRILDVAIKDQYLFENEEGESDEEVFFGTITELQVQIIRIPYEPVEQELPRAMFVMGTGLFMLMLLISVFITSWIMH